MAKKQTVEPGSEPAKRMAAQWFARARDGLNKGNYDYAIKMLKEACKLDPCHMGYRQLLRSAARKKWGDNKRGSRLAAVTTVKSRTALKAAKARGEYYRALEHCEDILAVNPWDTGTLLNMAAIFDRLGQPDLAVWSAKLALEKDPADPAVNRALAEYYEKRGDFTKAMDCWERVKKARPEDQEADKKLKGLAAFATIDKGGYEKASSFTDAIADKQKTQELLDEAKGGTGEDRLAYQAQQIMARIQRDPKVLAPYLQLSELYRRYGQYGKAAEVVEQALAQIGEHIDLIAEQENVEIGRMNAELDQLRKQLNKDPEDQALQQRYRALAKQLNDYELACYKRRSEHNPADLGVRAELGIRLAKAGRHDEAIVELQKARAEPRRKAEVLKWIGRCFHSKKNLRMARRHYEQALEAVAEADEQAIKEVHYLLGRVCEDLGDRSAAIEHYEKVAEIDYGYRDVAQRLDQLTLAEQAQGELGDV